MLYLDKLVGIHWYNRVKGNIHDQVYNTLTLINVIQFIQALYISNTFHD